MKRAAAKIVSKLLNFEQKQRHMDIAQEMLTTCNDDPDLLIKVTNYGRMTLRPKPNYRNGNVQKSQDRKKHVKFGQM